MPVFLKDGRAVLFIHIPKTGGSTIERLFQQSGWKQRFRETRKSAPAVFPLRRCSPQHHHGALLNELFDITKFESIFLISRDPLSRFRSEYLMRHTNEPRTDAAAVAAWHDKVFARYAENPYHLDNHLRPQHEFLLPGTRVFRLEDSLEAAVATLNAEHDFGLATEMPHALNSQQRSGVSSSAVELSAEVEASLRSRYAEDFTTFGYA